MKNGLNMSYVGVWTMSMGGTVDQPARANAALKTANPLKISQKRREANPRTASVSSDHSVAVSMLREMLVEMLDSVGMCVGWCDAVLWGRPCRFSPLVNALGVDGRSRLR